MSKQVKDTDKTSSMSFAVTVHKVLRHLVCIFLCCLSLFPFIIMVVNATRPSAAIESKFTLIPSNSSN